MTRRILALLLIVLPLAIACRTVTYNQEQHTEYWYTTSGTGAALDAGPHRMGTTSTIVGPVLPVNIEDDAGDILGASVSHPIVTTGGGGYVTIDGGTVTVSPNPLPVTFDAGNAATSIVGIVPVSFDGGSAYTGADLVPGDLSSSISATTQATSSALVKAQAGTFILANACNEGTVLAWLQFYNAVALDAGGLDAAATAPKILPLRLAAGACGSLREPNAGFTNGIVWYSSLSQGLVNNPGGSAPMAVDVTYR